MSAATEMEQFNDFDKRWCVQATGAILIGIAPWRISVTLCADPLL
jgi:hypothetical protein